MRKVLLICAAIAASTAMFGQKKNVSKAVSAINAAALNPKEINYEKVNEAWELIQPAMTDPVSSVMADTWYVAARVQCYYMNKMLIDRSTNGGQMDMDKFFQNQYDIVSYFSKCDLYEHTPNAKGKMPKEKYRKMNQQLAAGPHQNLLIAGSNLVSTDPEKCIKFLDLYFTSFDDSLFNGMNLAEKDTMRNDAYFIYATALKSVAKTPEDTIKFADILTKSLESNTYGKNACFELMQISKSRGDLAKWSEYCNIGIEKYPSEAMFLKVLTQDYMEKKDWAKAMVLCDKNIERFPNDDWGYYNKALIYFNQEKYIEANEAFKKVAEVNPTNAESWVAAGKSAWKLAQNNSDKKDISKQYYLDAINCFEKAREIEPGKSDLWGYSLYACYNNSGNLKKAKEFEKYAK